MPNCLQLVAPRPDPDTVETLQGLLKQAQDGRLTGLAFVALGDAGVFTGDVLGSAKGSPYQTIGLLRALEIKITLDL
jgi:hypothetical protein